MVGCKKNNDEDNVSQMVQGEENEVEGYKGEV